MTDRLKSLLLCFVDLSHTQESAIPNPQPGNTADSSYCILTTQLSKYFVVNVWLILR